MAALDAVATPNASATPRAIVRIIVASSFLRFNPPRLSDSNIGGRQASIRFDKDNDVLRGRSFIKLNAVPGCRRKRDADDSRDPGRARSQRLELVQRSMPPAFSAWLGRRPRHPNCQCVRRLGRLPPLPAVAYRRPQSALRLAHLRKT
jgi:hypothetical protein